jgi:hypothetical protein
MARPQSSHRWIALAAVLAAAGVFVWEPWHGPVILALSSTHGFDAGDLPAILLVALAVAIAHSAARGARSCRRASLPAWLGPASAVAVGAILVVALADTPRITNLLPAGGGTFGGVTQHADGQDPDPVGRWSHLAVTYDGGVVRLYVNGSEVSSRSTTGTIRKTPDPLWIGGNQPYGEYFDGEIDDVRVYDRALEPAEIRAEMSGPLSRAGSTTRSGLVAAYEFDAGSGTRARDASGWNNSGSIIGATWTPHGRFGDALSFDGADEMVRVPPSRSLDLTEAMTLAAWVRPVAYQPGWRTVLHRQTDAYFLTAGGGESSERLAAADGLRLGALIVATLCLCLALIARGGAWVAGGRGPWWPPIVLFVAGSLVDAALDPSATLAGPTLVAIWFAVTAANRFDAAVMWLVAAGFTAISAASLAGAIDLPGDDGSLARAGALGALLIVIGVLGARRVRRATASSG